MKNSPSLNNSVSPNKKLPPPPSKPTPTRPPGSKRRPVNTHYIFPIIANPPLPSPKVHLSSDETEPLEVGYSSSESSGWVTPSHLDLFPSEGNAAQSSESYSQTRVSINQKRCRELVITEDGDTESSLRSDEQTSQLENTTAKRQRTNISNNVTLEETGETSKLCFKKFFVFEKKRFKSKNATKLCNDYDLRTFKDVRHKKCLPRTASWVVEKLSRLDRALKPVKPERRKELYCALLSRRANRNTP
ncbi:hypothetical protein GIB67_026767 [Kingdonia uniflora]|uniref:Uncharacterized protein n=1 Tax=Kingdonia uniflora TaxID=39325 RepID=A0A7J7MHI2_9MAGN|nr:hypothetical protein GIB67_026767 [Kingdonia uniflora]